MKPGAPKIFEKAASRMLNPPVEAPNAGIEVQRQRRAVEDLRKLCSGPGKLCQALAITGEHDGLALDRPPFRLEERRGVPQIVTGPRIGITRAAELPWRYGLEGSPFLSRVLRSA